MAGITTKYDYARNIVSLIKTVFNTRYKEYEIIKPKTVYVTSVYKVYTAIKVNKKFNGKIVTSYKIPTNIRQLLRVDRRTVQGKPITKYKGVVTTTPATTTTKAKVTSTSAKTKTIPSTTNRSIGVPRNPNQPVAL